MVHSFEILRAREGGFDQAAFVEKTLEMIASIWTAVGTGNLGSIRPLLAPWCSRQWEQAPPHFVPAHPPSLRIEQLTLLQAIPGDDVDLVEVGIWTPEGHPPLGFPVVWTFARPRGPGGDAAEWKLELVRRYEEPQTS
ncbi:MAG: Tim44 domain-containing protein [Candidatus Dormibacteraeota bacterium]|nr:Tim44 domain-containing protein [Candidatus Dormibacteraeota bacterium]